MCDRHRVEHEKKGYSRTSETETVLMWVWRWKTKKPDFLHFLLRHRKPPQSCQEQEGLSSSGSNPPKKDQPFRYTLRPRKTQRVCVMTCPCVFIQWSSYRKNSMIHRIGSLFSRRYLTKKWTAKTLDHPYQNVWHFPLLLSEFSWMHGGWYGTSKHIRCWLNDLSAGSWENSESASWSKADRLQEERQNIQNFWNTK